MTALYEKYRPKRLSEVVGQKKAVTKIKHILKRNAGGRAFWISGPSGSGKTTLGRIIAGQVADEFFVQEYDSAGKVGTETLADIDRAMHLYSTGKGGRAFIINEAHGLRQWIIQELLGLLERIPGHVVFIFTTTKKGQAGLFESQIDASPLLSRCIYIELTKEGLVESFARRCYRIANKENLNGRPLRDYRKMARECDCNCRAMLQAIEAGEMLR